MDAQVDIQTAEMVLHNTKATFWSTGGGLPTLTVKIVECLGSKLPYSAHQNNQIKLNEDKRIQRVEQLQIAHEKDPTQDNLPFLIAGSTLDISLPDLDNLR